MEVPAAIHGHGDIPVTIPGGCHRQPRDVPRAAGELPRSDAKSAVFVIERDVLAFTRGQEREPNGVSGPSGADFKCLYDVHPCFPAGLSRRTGVPIAPGSRYIARHGRLTASSWRATHDSR